MLKEYYRTLIAVKPNLILQGAAEMVGLRLVDQAYNCFSNSVIRRAKNAEASGRITLVLYRCDLKVTEMIVCRKEHFIRRAVPSALPYEAWREGNDSSWNPPTTYPAIERSASEPRGDGAAASIKVARGQG